ncbi:MAG: HIT family protein [Actinomycetota bacterium]|nr:HIT family protein [Actinomycetota bacterium]
MANCVFCDLLKSETVVQRSDRFGAFFDAYPVSPGHLLIVPLRHFESFFEFDQDEAAELYPFVAGCKDVLDRRFEPSGYNLGVNAGRAAGQTVMHAHLHLIPRYSGDVPDPRGGVRGIFPDIARYWDA